MSDLASDVLGLRGQAIIAFINGVPHTTNTRVKPKDPTSNPCLSSSRFRILHFENASVSTRVHVLDIILSQTNSTVLCSTARWYLHGISCDHSADHENRLDEN